MRYTVTKQRVEVLGCVWMPYGAMAAIERDLSAYDLDNIGNPRDREAVASWIDRNMGDFSSVTDFAADFHIGDDHVVHDWTDPENELAYNDCMYGSEEG